MTKRRVERSVTILVVTLWFYIAMEYVWKTLQTLITHHVWRKKTLTNIYTPLRNKLKYLMKDSAAINYVVKYRTNILLKESFHRFQKSLSVHGQLVSFRLK